MCGSDMDAQPPLRCATVRFCACKISVVSIVVAKIILICYITPCGIKVAPKIPAICMEYLIICLPKRYSDIPAYVTSDIYVIYIHTLLCSYVC